MRTARFSACVFVFALMTTAAYAQCPAMSVIGPPGLTWPGERMTFRVDGAPADLRYTWTITHGTISEGQGTPAITVATDKSMYGLSVTAKVQVNGLDPSCPATASDAAQMAQKLPREIVDEWSADLRADDQRARLDNFFADLANNPTNTGFIILKIPTNERRGVKNQHFRLVIDHVRFRKFDIRRLWFSFETYPQLRIAPKIVLYRFYPGTEEDIPCDNCKIIKGGDL